MGSSLSGHLRVTATPALGRARIVPAIGAFTQRHPEISIELILSTRRFDLVDEGIDLAVREGPLPDSSLIATKLGTFRIMLCASSNYLSEKGRPSRPSDLERFDIVSVPTAGPETDPRRMGFPGIESIDLRPQIVVNDLFAVRDLARRDLGIAPLPDYMIEKDLADGRLIAILPSLRWPSMPITALVPERRFQPNRVKALLEFLVEHFRSSRNSRGR